MEIDLLNEYSNEPAFWMERAESYYVAVKIISYTEKHPIPDGMNIESRFFFKDELISPGLLNVTHYLMGTSLELLFKAILLKKNREDKIASVHNLSDFANKVKLEVTEKEDRVLKFLTEVLYNYGRYLNVSNPGRIEIGPIDQSKTVLNMLLEIKHYNIVKVDSYIELYDKIRSVYEAI